MPFYAAHQVSSKIRSHQDTWDSCLLFDLRWTRRDIFIHINSFIKTTKIGMHFGDIWWMNLCVRKRHVWSIEFKGSWAWCNSFYNIWSGQLISTSRYYLLVYILGGSASSVPDDLQEVSIPILSDSSCRGRWGSSVDSNQHVCAGQSGRGLCQVWHL